MKSYWIYVQVLGLSICFTFGYQIWADIDIQSCARTLSNSPAFSIRPGYVGEDIELRSQVIPPFSVSKKHQVIYLDEESRKDFLLKFMNNKIRIG